MTDSTETSGQDTFVSHLVELRDRLVKAIFAWLVVLIPLITPPWFLAGKLYDFVAQPMIDALPVGSKMIATGVIAPFFIPLKIAMLGAFLGALPIILYQAWAFVAPGLYKHEKRFTVFRRHGILLFLCVPNGVCLYRANGTEFDHRCPRY